MSARTKMEPNKRSRGSAATGGLATVGEAVVSGCGEEPSRVRVRRTGEGADRTERSARVATSAPYVPAPGDRVVVAGEGDDLFVIGVLHTASPRALPLSCGGRVEVSEAAAEIFDAEGRLCVRWSDGAAEISAPSRDLTLSAPRGKVVLESGTDVELHAGRDVHTRAERRVHLSAGREDEGSELRVGARAIEAEAAKLSVSVVEGSVVAERASVRAREVTNQSQTWRLRAERVEIEAGRIVEKARDVLREATELAESRAGRARLVVAELFSIASKRTALKSKEDTSIDGRRVLLG